MLVKPKTIHPSQLPIHLIMDFAEMSQALFPLIKGYEYSAFKEDFRFVHRNYEKLRDGQPSAIVYVNDMTVSEYNQKQSKLGLIAKKFKRSILKLEHDEKCCSDVCKPTNEEVANNWYTMTYDEAIATMTLEQISAKITDATSVQMKRKVLINWLLNKAKANGLFVGVDVHGLVTTILYMRSTICLNWLLRNTNNDVHPYIYHRDDSLVKEVAARGVTYAEYFLNRFVAGKPQAERKAYFGLIDVILNGRLTDISMFLKESGAGLHDEVNDKLQSKLEQAYLTLTLALSMGIRINLNTIALPAGRDDVYECYLNNDALSLVLRSME